MATRFDPSGPLRGWAVSPADKSISHRAALIAAMADGKVSVGHYLDAADTRSTLEAITRLGCRVRTGEVVAAGSGRPGDLAVSISGIGLQGAVSAAIDVGNAGTLLRLLPGWLAGQPGGTWEFDGDESIRRRPVDRITEPLARMGAQINARGGRFTPMTIEGEPLRGISYEMPIASAQVKSCLIFAGLLAEGETRIVEPLPTRDHTERMLSAAGAEIERDGDAVVVRPCERLEPGEIVVPGDISSAALFIVAALLVEGSEVRLEGVGINPTRTGLLAILERMGAEIDVEPDGEQGGEPTGTIIARSADLRATDVGGAEVPLAIDELPLVALAACFAEGTTTIADAAELRRKESDRIAIVAEALNGLGGRVEATEDGMVVEGTGGLRGGRVDSHGDHRIAMLGAVAGVASREGVEVEGMDAAAVSYPGFEEDLSSLVGRGAG